jgi:hypothetical protein
MISPPKLRMLGKEAQIVTVSSICETHLWEFRNGEQRFPIGTFCLPLTTGIDELSGGQLLGSN